MRNERLNALDDHGERFASIDLGKDVLQVAAGNDTAALALYPWGEMQSDAALSRFAFAGIAAHHTRPAAAGDAVGGRAITFVNDFAWMSVFEVRL